MLSRQHTLYQQLLQVADGLLLVGLIWVSHAVRYYALNEVSWLDSFPFEPQLANSYWMMVVALITGPLALEYMGIYQAYPQISWARTVGRIGRALLIVLLAIFTYAIVVHVAQITISRAALGIFFLLGLVVISARCAIFSIWLRQRGGRAHLRQYILLCGSVTDREQWKSRFLSQPGKNFEVKAEFDLRKEGLSRFVETLHDETVDIVVFSLDEHIVPQVREALLACEAEGVEAWMSANFIPTLFTNVQFDQFAGHPLLIYRTAPEISWELVAKRLIDVAGSIALLIVTSPIMLAVAIAIRATSKGPVIFSQNRSGLHGRPFRMYKFRTMVTNAEQARAELEDRNEMSGPVFKVKDDPRVTPVGRWLRRLSLDELPQLWNVIRGEMSVVGPRPLPLYETANFGDISQRRRMSVRPGLTCLWQVRGRNQISNFKDWVRLDLEYIDQWSLWLDLKILFMTVPVVLFGWGAK